MRILKVIFLMSIVLGFSRNAAADKGGGIIINGKTLDQNEVMQLQQIVGAAVVPGNYWYDGVSGLWGYIGGPYSGQILPGLSLGELPPDASGRGTNVYINGREIHPTELTQLQQGFGVIQPGRYWLNAQGIGGYEGGPAQFNLLASRGGTSSQGGGGMYGGYTERAAGGSVGSDGNCSYYMAPDGSSVMTGNC